MGGSTADTPTTPEFLRVSDADRDHAVDELSDEFVNGRLSHKTFVYRMQTALDARNAGQLAGLFTDLPPRRTPLLARIKSALRGDSRSSRTARVRANQGIAGSYGVQGGPGSPVIEVPQADRGNRGGYGVQAAQYYGPSGASASTPPLSFPPGRGGRFTIGRTRDCDLRLSDLSVSRLHAELVRNGAGWLLSDLGSHNGTRLNGWLVRETVPVRGGDRVQFGSVTFILRDDPQGPALSGSGDRTD